MTKSPQTRDSIVLFIVLFILIVATISILAVFFSKDRMQQDISEKIHTRLELEANDQYEHIAFSLDGLDVIVRGRVADDQQRQQVLAQIGIIDGVRMVHNEMHVDPSLIKTAEKTLIKADELAGYFELSFDAGKWQLAGDVDTLKTKTQLTQAVHNVLSQELEDQLQTDAVEEQPRWVKHFLDHLEQFSLVQGNVELSLKAGLLFISGDVNSPTEKRMVLLSLREQFGENARIQEALRILQFNDEGFYQPPKQPAIEQLDLSGITFKIVKNDNNKSRLTLNSSAKEPLQALLNTLEENPRLVIEIAGHTNDNDDMEKNRRRSLAKALIIKQWLVKQGIDKQRLKTSGYGSQRLLTDNPELAEKINERVEITVIKGG